MQPRRHSLSADLILVNARCDQPGKPGRIEHLGLGYLAATLRQQGWRALVQDAGFHGIAASEVVSYLTATSSYAIGFTVFLNNIRETLKIINQLRSAGDTRHISLGGHHATFNYQEILLHVPELDAVVLGEGEPPMLDLIERLAAGLEWRGLPGLAYRTSSGQVAVKPCRPLIPDLDTLPFPDRRTYEETMRQEKRATVLSSRGCYGNCAFCSIRAFYGLGAGSRWRGRSPENVVSEIEELVDNYGVRHIEFADDNLIGGGRGGKERARAIGREILRRRLDLEFFFICRPNDVDSELLGFLKEAGLKGVDIGVESWVPRQLALYNKGLRLEDNIRAVKILQDLNLLSRFYLIPSDPYATIDELLENLAAVERLGLSYFPDSAVFNRLTVFKGSPIEKQISRDGLLRPPRSGFSFKGALDYSFVHSDMELLHAVGEVIYKQFSALAQRLERTFATPHCNALEQELQRQLHLALRQAVFSLFKESALACRDRALGNDSDIPGWLADPLQTLEQQVAAIETRHEEGVFHRFSTVAIQLGESRLLYPPSFVRSLAEKLEATFREEISLDVRSSPDQLPIPGVSD